MSRLLEVPLDFFFLLHIQINRLITLISNRRSLLAHIYIVRAGLTKVQGVPTALHRCCFFLPQPVSLHPVAFVVPCGLAALAMKSFSFSLLTAALFVVGVSAQENQLTIDTPSVLLDLLLAQFYAYIQSLVQDERGSTRTSENDLVWWRSFVYSFFLHVLHNRLTLSL